jgi:MoCo/4Fe-4S cofactor protein with predicted Tat translocation signal
MPPLNGQWRSLGELADDPKFLARATEEFPGLAEALGSSVDRRRTVKLMAAAFAMAGLGGCEWAPTGTLVPAVKAPPNIIPALPNFYATAHLFNGYATGIVVKHFMGRPIKVEGNPQHPASLGATDVFAQAEVLDFYDPDRAWAFLRYFGSRACSWSPTSPCPASTASGLFLKRPAKAFGELYEP